MAPAAISDRYEEVGPLGVNGGDSQYSYSQNSSLQRKSARSVEEKIEEAIIKNFDVEKLWASSKRICLADLGCATGPNTFLAMQKVMEVIKQKYQSLSLTTETLEFQVFFNDLVSNDFNTLFRSIPSQRHYFVAGVPGSFHGRLFPESSIHFLYNLAALHWISMVPDELLDSNCPAWNKGRVHYVNAPDEVVNAYDSQFVMDFESYLSARAVEIVIGGMMVFIIPIAPKGMPFCNVAGSFMFDAFGSILYDMAKEGLVDEAEVDSFNLPMYFPSPETIVEVIERNGCFDIERMEIKNPFSEGPVNTQEFIPHVRAAMEGMFVKHFANNVVDEMFDRLASVIGDSADKMETGYRGGCQLFAVLIRK